MFPRKAVKKFEKGWKRLRMPITFLVKYVGENIYIVFRKKNANRMKSEIFEL